MLEISAFESVWSWSICFAARFNFVTPDKSVINTSGACGEAIFVSTFVGATSTPSIEIETALGNDAGGTFTDAFPTVFLSVAVPSRYGLVEWLPVPEEGVPYSS